MSGGANNACAHESTQKQDPKPSIKYTHVFITNISYTHIIIVYYYNKYKHTNYFEMFSNRTGGEGGPAFGAGSTLKKETLPMLHGMGYT